MGVWGPGNFDSDTAADHLSDLTTRLVDEVKEAMEGDPVGLEPDEYDGTLVPCNLELLGLIAEQGFVGAALPDGETLRAWKATFLEVWDDTIDGLDPDPEYKAKRRVVLVDTFDRLIALADET